MARQPNGTVHLSRLRTLLSAAVLACALAPPAIADMIATGIDTYVEYAAPDAIHGTDIVLQWDAHENPALIGPQTQQGLLKFDLNLDAPAATGTLRQRILAAPGVRARLVLNVENSGDEAMLHRMLQEFDSNTTWNSLGGGVQTSGPGQNAETTSTASTSGALNGGTITIDVTQDLLAWANGAPNHGWALLSTGNDGVTLTSFEGGAGAPVLIIDRVTNLVAPGPTGTTWRYYDAIAPGDPSYPTDAQGEVWYGAAFDDGSWNSGTGQFGYGEGDETIVLDNGQGGGSCTGSNPCRVTYLFRTTFEITEIPDSLIAEIMYDDAVKLYLNGVEVVLANLTNPVDAATFADVNVAGPDEGFFVSFELDPAVLVTGTNTIAVEIHNWNTNSSDISFDMLLQAVFDDLLPVPEPGTGSLLGLGLVALAAIRRRSRRR